MFEPTFLLGAANNYLENTARSIKVRTALIQLGVQVSKLLGGDSDIAETDMKTIIQLETDLAKV